MKSHIIAVLLLLLSSSVYAGGRKSVLEDSRSLGRVLTKNNVWGERVFIGYTGKHKPIYGYYYNKGGTDKALVIAGIHGSEFYGVDVAYALKDSLDRMKPRRFKWKVLLIPELFADNVEEGRRNIFEVNYGRKTCKICFGVDDDCSSVDPNRQMPMVNALYQPGQYLSCMGDTIEMENRYLLQVTQQFNPSRIVSIHCKNEARNYEIGIYADPRTGPGNIALGYARDAIIAIRMAFIVKEQGGIIAGNFINQKHVQGWDSCYVQPVSYLNTVYPQDPPASNKGARQDRNYEQNHNGVTYGTWASSEVRENHKLLKQAATMITIEMPQYYSFFSIRNDLNSLRRDALRANTIAYIKAIRYGFLQ